MTIEVRQLTIRSTVGNDTPAQLCGSGSKLDEADIEQLKADILAQCKAWIREQTRSMQER